MLSNEHQQKISENQRKSASKFTCSICNKMYKDNSGLWRHKKKCKQIGKESSGGGDSDSDGDQNSADIKQSLLSDKELMMMLVKQN
jgi:hypothetical protein